MNSENTGSKQDCVEKPRCLIGCAILRNEILWLIEKHRWPLRTIFLDSSLHNDPEGLSTALITTLSAHQQCDTIIFYGACHPHMDEILSKTSALRTPGQNCVEILLGHDLFTEELSRGAYFLFEDWAIHWDSIITSVFGNNWDVTKEIFQGDRKYMLAIKTPCSGDFAEYAIKAAASVGLPLRFMEAPLEYLESALIEAINRSI